MGVKLGLLGKEHVDSELQQVAKRIFVPERDKVTGY
jgi:hypothetical protein